MQGNVRRFDYLRQTSSHVRTGDQLPARTPEDRQSRHQETGREFSDNNSASQRQDKVSQVLHIATGRGRRRFDQAHASQHTDDLFS